MTLARLSSACARSSSSPTVVDPLAKRDPSLVRLSEVVLVAAHHRIGEGAIATAVEDEEALHAMMSGRVFS